MRILDEKFRNQFVMITGTQSLRVRDLFGMIREASSSPLAGTT